MNLLESKGIHPLFEGIKISVDNIEDEVKLRKKLIGAAKRKITLSSMTMEEIESFIKIPSEEDGRYQIVSGELTSNEAAHAVIKACLKTSDEDISYMRPLLLKIRRILPGGDESEYEVYTVQDATIPQKYHDRTLSLRGRKGQFRIVDLKQLLASMLVFNQLHVFSIVYRSRILLENMKARMTIISQANASFPIPEKHEPYYEEYMELFSILADGRETRTVPSVPEHWLFSRSLYNSSNASLSKTFVEEVGYLNERQQQEYERSKFHARVFEEKKHINDETMDRMKKNVFLETFGEVEIDNEMDLHRFSEIENEFLQWQQQFALPSFKDHDLRFRKLGRHKAAGLYFPFQKCVAVDIREPYSFIHEVGHMIDYTYGERKSRTLLSEKMDFQSILLRYRLVANQEIDLRSQDDPFVKKWIGKGKFNRHYYFQPTEVFARCFEIYVSSLGKWKHIGKTSFQNSVIYPTDEQLLRDVESYFEKIMKKIGPQSTTHEKKNVTIHPRDSLTTVASGSPSDWKQPIRSKQLSLF